MPPDSALAREVDPEGIGKGWDRTAHLLALLTEVSDNTNMLLFKANFKSTGRDPEPIRISRPGREINTKPLEGDEMETALLQMGGAVVKGKTKRKAK